MIIFNDEVNPVPNYLREADEQEGHDYELDALREAQENWVDDDDIDE